MHRERSHVPMSETTFKLESANKYQEDSECIGRSEKSNHSETLSSKRDGFQDKFSTLPEMINCETSMTYLHGTRVVSEPDQGRPNRNNAPKRMSRFISSRDAGFKLFRGAFGGKYAHKADKV